MPGTRIYFEAYEDLMKELGGRPHWAKDFTMSEQEFAQSLEHWEDFKRVRLEMDPSLIFSNTYLERLIPSQRRPSTSSRARLENKL